MRRIEQIRDEIALFIEKGDQRKRRPTITKIAKDNDATWEDHRIYLSQYDFITGILFKFEKSGLAVFISDTDRQIHIISPERFDLSQALEIAHQLNWLLAEEPGKSPPAQGALMTYPDDSKSIIEEYLSETNLATSQLDNVDKIKRPKKYYQKKSDRDKNFYCPDCVGVETYPCGIAKAGWTVCFDNRGQNCGECELNTKGKQHLCHATGHGVVKT